MPVISNTRVHPRLPMIATLYVGQYLGIGFFYFGINGVLREAGIDLAEIAVVQLIGALWILKALWAPLVDCYSLPLRGHYRSWLLILQPLTALTLLALLPFGDVARSLDGLIAVLAVYIAVTATQDIATDAIVTRYVTADRQGVANATATAGQWVGNILGGGATLLVYDTHGWVPAVLLLVVLTLTPTALVVAFVEPDTAVDATGDAPSDATLAQRYRDLGAILRMPGRPSWLVGVLPLYWACGVGTYGMLSLGLKDAGWSLSEIAVLLGFVTAVPGALGAVVSAWALNRWGLPQVCRVSGVTTALATLLLIPLFLGESSVVVVGVPVCLYVLSMSVVSTAVYRAHVLLSRPERAGSDFTALTSAGILSTSVVGYIAITIASYSYPAAVATLACGVAVGGFRAANNLT